MNDFGKKDILIYRADNVYVEHVDNRIEGDLNKVVWNDLDKITDALINIISAVDGKTEAVSYYSTGEKNTVRVGKRIAALFDPEKIDIELLATTFMREITKHDDRSGELFSQHSSPFNEIVKKEAQNFLLQNSNKSIKQGLEIRAGDSLMKVSGRFSQLANSDQIEDDPPEAHTGVVDGLVKHSRTVHLRLTSQKIVVVYFNQNDFRLLHHLMQSEELHQFTLQKKYDAGGKKKDMYLISVAKSSERLLDFSA